MTQQERRKWQRILVELETAIARMRCGLQGTDTFRCIWYEGIQFDAADELREAIGKIPDVQTP